jgi:hypothetical protein
LAALPLMAFASLACVTIMGAPPTPAGRPPLTATVNHAANPPEESAACLQVTDAIFDLNLGADSADYGEELPDVGGRYEGGETYIISYRIAGDLLVDPALEEIPQDLLDEQEDRTFHREIWKYFAALIPPDSRAMLVEFWIVTDGPDNLLAAVSQSYEDPERWVLEVDAVDSSEIDYLTFTLLHEFGHLLTLGPDQVPPSEAIFNNPEDNDIYRQEVSACPNYFPGEGCARADSYINLFHARFWPAIQGEWDAINLQEDDDLYYEALDRFYSDHSDEFLTDYAATHPAEDIAESFAFFVLGQSPSGDLISDQKIRFFEEFPELVRLRERIRSNLCRAYPG